FVVCGLAAWLQFASGPSQALLGCVPFIHVLTQTSIAAGPGIHTHIHTQTPHHTYTHTPHTHTPHTHLTHSFSHTRTHTTHTHTHMRSHTMSGIFPSVWASRRSSSVGPVGLHVRLIPRCVGLLVQLIRGACSDIPPPRPSSHVSPLRRKPSGT